MIHRLRLLLGGRVPFFAKEAFLRLRELNADQRALPDFLIIGAQKAGTTSLHNYLCLHPQVIGSLPKEIFFFCSHPERGARWYRRHFPTRRSLRRSGAICGEATPTYLYSAQAAERASGLIPKARLIVLLREPAARAVSQYYHRVRAGRETRTVNEVFTPEAIARFQAGKPSDPTERIVYERSLYAEGLSAWLEHFPREQLLVLEAEALFKDPQALFDRVCQFLGISRFDLPSTSVFNKGAKAQEQPEHFEALAGAFAGPNQALHQLGYEMEWMSR